MTLKMDTRTVEGVAVVSCSGRIVFGEEANALRDTLKKLLTTSKQVVLNLSGELYRWRRSRDAGRRLFVGARGWRRHQTDRTWSALTRCSCDHQTCDRFRGVRHRTAGDCRIQTPIN